MLSAIAKLTRPAICFCTLLTATPASIRERVGPACSSQRVTDLCGSVSKPSQLTPLGSKSKLSDKHRSDDER